MGKVLINIFLLQIIFEKSSGKNDITITVRVFRRYRHEWVKYMALPGIFFAAI